MMGSIDASGSKCLEIKRSTFTVWVRVKYQIKKTTPTFFMNK